MQNWLADPLFGGAVQGGRHLFELFAAFALTALIGLERTVQGNVAGPASPMLITAQTVMLGPARVAAQIVSGIGYATPSECTSSTRTAEVSCGNC
jgi:putative Mg2+ transporter-C (MgtC) family protein